MKRTTKQFGDAGEWYVAGKLGMHGFPVVVMPDNWPDFDILVHAYGREIKVQVKTFANLFGSGWNPHIGADVPFDFLAIVDAADDGACWLVPADVVKQHLKYPRPEATNQKPYLPKKYLNGDLVRYRDNWSLTA